MSTDTTGVSALMAAASEAGAHALSLYVALLALLLVSELCVWPSGPRFRQQRSLQDDGLAVRSTTLAFSVGWSRIFLEAHSASDVLARFASGTTRLAVVLLVTESRIRGWRPSATRRGPSHRTAAG